MILDFDSSVNTVYGNQESAEVGYNSTNPGKKSMHPLYVFEGSRRLCLYAKLRNGKAYTSDGMIEAAEESLKHVCSQPLSWRDLTKDFQMRNIYCILKSIVTRIQVSQKEVLNVGKLKLYKNLVRKGLEKTWCRVYEGTKIIEWTEIEHQAQSWSKPRRVILIRMEEASDFEEPYLSEEFLWEYQALVTNMNDSGDEGGFTTTEHVWKITLKSPKMGLVLIKFQEKIFMQISLTYGSK